MYITHEKYATAPSQYIRAFLVLQKDLKDLFDYIEPADINISCYSYRIHQLLMRFCIEIEANCKAILIENGKKGPQNWTMRDYEKLAKTHLLHEYEVRLPLWNGQKGNRKPFSAWGTAQRSLPFYQSYNASKHDRHNHFHLANFDSLIDSACALVAIISAQFYTHDFMPDILRTGIGDPTDGFDIAIGELFHVKFPDWPPAERYDFDWRTLKKNSHDPFDDLTF